jgi:PqqD family protein of HPr-rel-A system
MLLNSDIVYRKLDGEEIILHLKTGTYFGLNQTGTVLFECCKVNQNVTEAELAHVLCEHFEIDPQTAQADVKTFLQAMRDNHLIAAKAGA